MSRSVRESTSRPDRAPMVRPGGRTARVRERVMHAVEDELMVTGVAGLSLGRVARVAGVGRATVYRRWGSVSELLADLVADMVATSLPATDLGDLRADLRAHAALVAKTLADPRQGPLFRALICAGLGDDGAGLADFYRARLADWQRCVVRAIERGQVPEGTRAAEVVVAASAPLYYHWLLLGRAPSRGRARMAADSAFAAAVAGAFRA